MVNNIFVNHQSDDNLTIILDDNGKIASGSFCIPEILNRILELNVKRLIVGDAKRLASFAYGRIDLKNMSEGRLNVNSFKKIQDALNSNDLEKLINETIAVGNEIIILQREMEDYINQQDDIDIDVSDLM